MGGKIYRRPAYALSADDDQAGSFSTGIDNTVGMYRKSFDLDPALRGKAVREEVHLLLRPAQTPAQGNRERETAVEVVRRYRADARDERVQALLDLQGVHQVAGGGAVRACLLIQPLLQLLEGDGQLVGQVAANVRKVRKPDAYHGKGVRFVGEKIALKAGKAGATGGKGKK